MAAGMFREDLYYRISEITVDIPPVRDRSWRSDSVGPAFTESFFQL